MDGETNGGQEATQGAQDQAQQQGQEQQETQQDQQEMTGGNAPDFKMQIADRNAKTARALLCDQGNNGALPMPRCRNRRKPDTWP